MGYRHVGDMKLIIKSPDALLCAEANKPDLDPDVGREVSRIGRSVTGLLRGSGGGRSREGCDWLTEDLPTCPGDVGRVV